MKIKFIAFATIILLISSCKKFLEPTPENSIAPENFFKKLPDLQATIIGAYDYIQDEGNAARAWGASNIIQRGGTFADEFRKGSGNDYTTSLNVTTIANPFASYQSHFRALNTVNNALFYGPGIPVNDAQIALKKHLLAEAKFIRAYTIFDLLRNWRNIALITKPTESYRDALPTKQYRYEQGVTNRSQKELEGIRQVVKDLIEAAPDLMVSYGSDNISTRGRATRGAAHALLARVYLWRATYENKAVADSVTFFYKEVIRLGDSIDNDIKKPLYEMVPGDQYSTIFTSKNSKESIFELQYNNIELNRVRRDFLPNVVAPATYGGTFQYRMNTENHFVSATGFNTSTGLSANSVSTAPMSWMEYQTTNRDTYMDGWYNSNSAGSTSVFVKDKRKSISIGYANFFFSPTGNTLNQAVNANAKNFWYLNKYQGTANSSGSYDNSDNLPLIRISDIYLMKAEAYNELGNTAQAKIELGKVKSRAGIPEVFWIQDDPTKSLKQNIFESILDERLLEFAGEGLRWYDLVRLDRIKLEMEKAGLSTLVDTQTEVERRNAIPIQPDRIAQYNLTQNPGW